MGSFIIGEKYLFDIILVKCLKGKITILGFEKDRGIKSYENKFGIKMFYCL